MGGTLRGRVIVNNDLRIIDSHVHFWDPARLNYTWLQSEPDLQRRFFPEDFISFAENALNGVVFVEASCLPSENMAEVALVESLMMQHPDIHGIVAYVDLNDPAARQRSLDALKQRKKVVGVRHNIQGKHKGYSLDSEFIRGVQAVGENGYPFDLCITADQLTEIIELVECCPGMRFVLDHCGKPSIRSEELAAWSENLSALARNEQVWCKVSGLFSEARGDQRDARGMFPYVQHALSCFGAHRLLYGSDWPVVTAAGGEPTWRSFMTEFTSLWTAADREAFFFGNATHFYNLGVS